MNSSDLEILSPDGAILRDPDQVERALSEMWKEAGEAATEDSPKAAATRICMANLVVAGESKQWSLLLEVLGELSPIYPTRTIALLLSDDDEYCGKPTESAASLQKPSRSPESVRASVSALCHVPQAGQPQVCCEQILLRVQRGQAGDLNRTILPLLEADVPVMVWWTIDPGACMDLLHACAQMSRRLILDAGLIGVSLLDRLPYPQIREVGWYCIHRWRELVASMFDECGGAPLHLIEEVQVEIGDAKADSVAAIWLIAFLAGQLGWQLRNADPGLKAQANEGSKQAFAKFEFAGVGQQIVRASILPGSGEGLNGLIIRCGANTFEARRGREELRIIVHDENVCQTPRVVHLPRLKRSDALAAALAGRAVDRAFSRAAPLAERMAATLRAG